MLRIYKYVLEEKSIQILELPMNSRILSVESQGEDIVLYVMVDAEERRKWARMVRIYGTGFDITPDIDDYRFLGTVKLSQGKLMFHVFYK
jgi:hypothetical protein